MSRIITKLKQSLAIHIEPKHKESICHFFKEKISSIGVRTPIVQKISAVFWKEVQIKEKKEILVLIEALVKTGIYEYQIVGFDWLYRLRSQYVVSDFIFFETCLKKYIQNWYSCDDFCIHTLGYYFFLYPKKISKVFVWTKLRNRWLRRAAAVCMIYSIRRGTGLKIIFTLADMLLVDSDDLVQKGYGWMLKEASTYFPKEVFVYVEKNKVKMPRTALRYAIEKLPLTWKKQAMGT